MKSVSVGEVTFTLSVKEASLFRTVLNGYVDSDPATEDDTTKLVEDFQEILTEFGIAE